MSYLISCVANCLQLNNVDAGDLYFINKPELQVDNTNIYSLELEVN